MFRIHLNKAEQTQITQTLQTSTNRRLHKRYQALLMAHHGYKRQHIATALDIHRGTLRQWLLHYRTGGLARLSSWDLPGPQQRIPDTIVPTIRQWIVEGPHRSDLAWDTWTYEKLAVKVHEETGICIRRTAMRNFCQRHHIHLTPSLVRSKQKVTSQRTNAVTSPQRSVCSDMQETAPRLPNA